MIARKLDLILGKSIEPSKEVNLILCGFELDTQGLYL